MAYVDDKMLRVIWKTIQSGVIKHMLKSIGENEVVTYTDMRNLIDRNSNLTAHYVKRLTDAGMMMCEDRHYFLTRIGIQCRKLVINFDEMCTKIEMSDLNRDGKVMKMVVRPLEI